MNTFLPYADYMQSAQCLDTARLGKQRVEVLQLLNVNLGDNPKAGWRNHPAAKMWRGCESELANYGLAICAAWIARGYKDTCFGKINAQLLRAISAKKTGLPPWLGDEEFHRSHRSNLLRKDEAFYRKFGWTEPTTLAYIWPSGIGDT